MIDQALEFLRSRLDSHLKPADQQNLPHYVAFVDGTKMEPLTFKSGGVSVLLVNIEQEKSLPPPDRYKQTSAAGTTLKVQPEIRLNLYALFVAHSREYKHSLKNLSLIIQYFQAYPLLNHQNAPELSEDIEQLVVELITLPFAEQNEVWSALRATYHPSVLYKVKMVVFQGEDVGAAPQIKTTETQLRTSR